MSSDYTTGLIDGMMAADGVNPLEAVRRESAAADNAASEAMIMTATAMGALLKKERDENNRLAAEVVNLMDRVEDLQRQLEEAHNSAVGAKAEARGWLMAAQEAAKEMRACPEEHPLVLPSGYVKPSTREALNGLDRIALQAMADEWKAHGWDALEFEPVQSDI